MKKCPYCAEWIQDEAIKCRYCLTDLKGTEGVQEGSQPSAAQPATAAGQSPPIEPAQTQPAQTQPATILPNAQASPTPSPAVARPGEGAKRFSHSGYRYVLGYGDDFFGIWERERPGGPTDRFPRTDQGWADAWTRFRELEPAAVEVPAPAQGGGGSGGSGPGGIGPGGPGGPAIGSMAIAVDTPSLGGAGQAPLTSTGPQIGEGALRFSHSGVRYLLGYGTGFFGIWDRQTAGGPVLQFPRNDQGWTEAWNRFTAWEPRAIEVPQSGPAPDTRLATGEFRSAQSRAKWAVVMLSIVALTTVLQFAFRTAELSLLTRIRDQGIGAVTTSEIQTNDDRIGAVAVIAGIAGIATIVLWLMWQHRAHANLRALGVGGLRFTPGWAVGWWFIPFANIVQPIRVNLEAWKASDPETGAVDWKGKRASPILAAWWAAWLLAISVFPTLALNAAPGERPPVTELLVRDRYLLAGNVLLVAAAVLAIMVVRGVTRRQEAKHQRVSQWALGLAPAQAS